MANHIADTLSKIDSAVGAYAETVFIGFGGPVATAIQAAGFVTLALIAVNSLMQFVPIRMSEYMRWGVRYVIILSVATTWSQFEPIYNILTDVPSSIGASLLAAAGGVPMGTTDLNQAMDQMVTGIFDNADMVSEKAGLSVSMAITSVILIVIGALMACVAIIVSAMAKIGLALAASLAPIAIGMLMFKGTSQLFETWTRFTLGFALIPMVLAGVMGAVIGVGYDMMDGNEAVEISQIAGFLIVAVSAIIMMKQVPTMVNTLAGSIVATLSPGAVAAVAGQTGARGAQAAETAARAGTRAAQVKIAQAKSAVDAARDAEGAGKRRVAAMYSDYRRNSEMVDKMRAHANSEARQRGLNPKDVRPAGQKQNFAVEAANQAIEKRARDRALAASKKPKEPKSEN